MVKKKIKPQRSCIICREKMDKNNLLRIVRNKEGQIEFDPTGKKNGRGAYICTSQNCLDTFLKKNALSRAFRTRIDSEDVNRIREQIKAHIEKSNRADSEAKL